MFLYRLAYFLLTVERDYPSYMTQDSVVHLHTEVRPDIFHNAGRQAYVQGAHLHVGRLMCALCTDN